MKLPVYIRCFLLFGLVLGERIKARVNLINAETSKSGGYLDLVQENGKLTITGKVTGLTPEGNHGFHVHEKGSTDNKCLAAGPHYNPFNKTHGAPHDTERHVGDLGNILSDDAGNANVHVVDSIALLNGQYSIMNRSIVIHKQADDLGAGGKNDSKTTGSAGARVMCGIIQEAESKASTTSGLSFGLLGMIVLLYCFQC